MRLTRQAEHRPRPRPAGRAHRIVLICAALLTLASPALAEPRDGIFSVFRSQRAPRTAEPTARAVAAALRLMVERGGTDAEVASFYRARGYRPLWAPGRLRPEAERLAETLDVETVKPRWEVGWRTREDPVRLAEVELALSQAYVAALSRGPSGVPGAGFDFVDPQLMVGKARAARPLDAAAQADDLEAHVTATLAARNPILAQLEAALERYRIDWGGLPDVQIPPGPALGPGSTGPRVAALRERLALPGGDYDGDLGAAVVAFQAAHGLPADGRVGAKTLAALNAGPAHFEEAIQINIERAKALPASFGERFILVDAAAGRLWLYEGGEERATMKVVTGKPTQPTPAIAAMAGHLIFNPYWNVPEDLVRTSIAPKVLKFGLGYIKSEGLEVLAGYADGAAVLDPAKVNWSAVARGKAEVRVRQRPGQKNMMGKVKLMVTNPLGIYLHDTPLRGDFARSQRFASSGCIRLEDAMALAKALIGEEAAEAAATGGAEEIRIDLEKPIPVYVTYFTVAPSAAGLEFRPDVYGRDSLRIADAGAAAVAAADGAR